MLQAEARNAKKPFLCWRTIGEFLGKAVRNHKGSQTLKESEEEKYHVCVNKRSCLGTIQAFHSVLVRALSETHPRLEEDLKWVRGSTGCWNDSTQGRAGKQGNRKGMVPASIKGHTANVVTKSWGRSKGDSLHVPAGQERRNWSEKQKGRLRDTDLLGKK